MKLGVCTGLDQISLAGELGFEYAETSLSGIAALEEDKFRACLREAAQWRIPLTHCNGFLPGHLPCTGPLADELELRAYMARAFDRAALLGVRTVVFGSGAARSVPAGWTHAQAWRQLARFLTAANDMAAQHGIQIAIEPLRRQESNILNTVAEATALAAMVNLPSIGVLGDTFHMQAAHEPYQALADAGALLKHVHISHSPARVFPADGDGEDYEALFDVLKGMGYDGGISVEAGTNDLRSDGAAAAARLGPMIAAKK